MPTPPPTEPPPPANPPRAWQPLTFHGVAAFSRAPLGRLFLAQAFTALLVSATVCAFLATAWFPGLRTAIQQLPTTGAIQAGQLNLPPPPQPALFENRFLSLFLNPSGEPLPPSTADLQIEFGPQRLTLTAGRGQFHQPYPHDRSLPFNQPDLQAAWDAWQPMLFGLACLGTLAFLAANWATLATLYSPLPWLFAYFTDRQLSPAGAWKLAAAALLPGALLATLGLALYNLGWINLTQFTLLWIFHLPAGWLYLAAAPRCLPRVQTPPPTRGNPFQPASPADSSAGDDPAAEPRSPFANPGPNPR
ncbi:MAG: hypothetical protein RJA22_922 [Verrucomicrobiota bacterium]